MKAHIFWYQTTWPSSSIIIAYFPPYFNFCMYELWRVAGWEHSPLAVSRWSISHILTDTHNIIHTQHTTLYTRNTQHYTTLHTGLWMKTIICSGRGQVSKVVLLLVFVITTSAASWPLATSRALIRGTPCVWDVRYGHTTGPHPLPKPS